MEKSSNDSNFSFNLGNSSQVNPADLRISTSLKKQKRKEKSQILQAFSLKYVCLFLLTDINHFQI